MDKLDKRFYNEIVEVLELKLHRELLKIELDFFKQKRLVLACEMILDYISKIDLTKQQLEVYV